MEVITAVTHPTTGLPVQKQWLPSVLEVREACERELLPLKNAAEREKRIAEQLAERAKLDEMQAKRPTYDDLKAKYGPTFGIGVVEEAKRKSSPASI